MTRRLALLFVFLVLCACRPATASSEPLLVAAASDLQFAFGEIGPLFEAETGQPVIFTFGSTGQLTTQIENGAPFDILAAANVDYIERLSDQRLTVPETEQLYAQGRLVLVSNRQAGTRATSLQDLLDPRIQRVAIANPAHAPYGLAAQQALQSAGVWEDVRHKLVLGENVSQTLQFVQTGDAAAGIVALSIAGVPEVTGILLPDTLHEPINQALTVLSSSRRLEIARAFVEFVNSPAGREVMKHYGFLLPGEF